LIGIFLGFSPSKPKNGVAKLEAGADFRPESCHASDPSSAEDLRRDEGEATVRTVEGKGVTTR
jgi:hypothetical protein